MGERMIPTASFNVSFKKLPGTQQLVDALAVVAAAGQLVRAAGVTYVFHRPSQYFQAAVKHFALYKTGAAIVFAVKDDIGRGDVLYISDGRLSFEYGFGGRFPGIAAKI